MISQVLFGVIKKWPLFLVPDNPEAPTGQKISEPGSPMPVETGVKFPFIHSQKRGALPSAWTAKLRN